MDNLNLQALVVDDDVMVRTLTMRALAREGFQCDAASDGNEALALANCTQYAAIVTDLKMPNMNGHALAVELLTREHRPLLFVLTAVTEPRLAKDLLHRGVADVLFKPIDYPLLAAKVKTRVAVNQARTPKQDHVESALQEQDSLEASDGLPQTIGSGDMPAAMDPDEYQRGLTRIGEVMPASEAALNVYRMAQSGNFDSQQLAHAIAKHEVLATEVIQLANTPFYNPGRTKISRLDRGAMQIGQKRVGQFALAASAQAATLGGERSPLNTDSLWRRSVAAGIAMELLVIRGNHNSISDGLLLCATMQELGRILLASLYPEHYERAIQNCIAQSRSLFELERATLPQSQNEVMCQVLESWNVASETFAPLRHVHKDYATVSLLPEPLRTQTELVKIAGEIARIAIGSWEPWDYVEIPTAEAIDRLGPLSLATIVNETKANVAGINAFGLPTADSSVVPSATHAVIPKALAYYDAASSRYDFLAEVLASMDITLAPRKNPAESQDGLLANCLGVRSRAMLSFVGDDKSDSNVVVICAPQDADYYGDFERTVIVPASYAALKNALAAR